MTQLIKNAARAALAAGIAAVDTSLTVDITKADLFPAADTGTDPVNTVGKDWFKIVVEDASHNYEIMYVRTRTLGSAVMGNLLRGQEGTTAISFAAGSVVGNRITADDYENALDLAAIATAYGKSLLGAANAAAARLALGFTTYFSTLVAAADAAAARTLLGFSTYFSTLVAAANSATARTLLGLGYATVGMFFKADPTTVAFTKTGADTAEIKAGTKIDVAGTLVEFAAATAITMPTLTAGTDYAIWIKDDATLQATTSFSSAPGAGNWRKIGGFHYAPGGNAAAVAGGDTTPAINEYSLWDLKFRPACPDPRGMTLVADSFWADIYLLGVDHLTNGTSKYNVTIADGSSPPKIPTKFGGNGSTAYSTLNWWEANEVLLSYGKRSPSYDEFAALAYGTTEATSSGGSDVPTTGVSGTGATNAWNKFTSRWGITQAAGCMWVWGAEFGGGAAGASWAANTGGRGSTYQMEKAVRLGGHWGYTTESGSRCSYWVDSPASSDSSIGARGVCDHLILD